MLYLKMFLINNDKLLQQQKFSNFINYTKKKLKNSLQTFLIQKIFLLYIILISERRSMEII